MLLFLPFTYLTSGCFLQLMEATENWDNLLIPQFFSLAWKHHFTWLLVNNNYT